jgi:hypothetical protein
MMKVIFEPALFRTSTRKNSISVKGSYPGLGINFLAVMARLYELPFLWFSEGMFIELDFESEKLILKAPEDKDGDLNVEEVVQTIPFNDLVTMTVPALRELYIRPFAANLAEFNFDMPKTAYAIRAYRHRSEIERLAFDEGHPVLDDEITNLLFRERWDMETSFNKRSAFERA